MNILKACTACILFCMFAVPHASAQQKTVPVTEPDYNKPHLFSDLPDSLQLNPQQLEGLFTLPMNSSVVIPLATSFRLQGTVVSKSDAANPQQQSVVIRSSNRLGAVLTLTRLVTETNEVQYTGSILSRRHGDAYELVNSNQQYFLIKKNFYDLHNE